MEFLSKNSLKIDGDLLQVKCHFFFFKAALAVVAPFKTIYAKQLGLSATEVGIIFAIVPFVRIVTNPLFGYILDYFKKTRLTISGTIILLTFSYACLVFIPSKKVMSGQNMNVTSSDFYQQFKQACQRNMTFSNICDNEFTMYMEYKAMEISFTCNIECPNSTGENYDCASKLQLPLMIIASGDGCDLDIQAVQRKLPNMSDKFRNYVLMSLKDSFKMVIKSQVSTSESSSGEVKGLVDNNLNARNATSDAIDISVHHAPGFQLGNLNNREKMYYDLPTFQSCFRSNSSFLESCDCCVQCRIMTKKPISTTSKQEPPKADSNDFKSIQFWSTLVLFSVASVAIGSTQLMFDAVCYEILKNKTADYGQQRLWGTVGMALSALVAGYLNQITSTGPDDTDYTFSFSFASTLLLISIIPIYFLRIEKVSHSPNIIKDVCSLFKHVNIVRNLVIVCISGGLMDFVWSYQLWFMEEIGSSQTLLGLSMTAQYACEILFLFVSGWIIKKMGHDFCCHIALLCFGLKFLSFVFTYDPLWVLATAPGPYFGLFVASMTAYAKNEAPAGTEATVQSIMHVCYEGIGSASGNLLGGIGVDYLGTRQSFLYASELSFAALLMNLLLIVFLSRNKRKTVEINKA